MPIEELERDFRLYLIQVKKLTVAAEEASTNFKEYLMDPQLNPHFLDGLEELKTLSLNLRKTLSDMMHCKCEYLCICRYRLNETRPSLPEYQKSIFTSSKEYELRANNVTAKIEAMISTVEVIMKLRKRKPNMWSTIIITALICLTLLMSFWYLFMQ